MKNFQGDDEKTSCPPMKNFHTKDHSNNNHTNKIINKYIKGSSEKRKNFIKLLVNLFSFCYF